MQIGAFSPEIHASDVEGVFARAQALGFTQMQYDFISSHGEEMPEAFYPNEVERVAQAARDYGIQITAVNGTFNMIDRDEALLQENIRRFRLIAEAARALDCGVVTLCTGSRHPESMWRYHSDTAGEDAWQQLLRTTRAILPFAEENGVVLGVETEASNTVFTIERTRRFLDEIANPRLKVIMDCANLFPAGTAHRENMRPTIRKAFDLLGQDIVLAHGKDVCEGDEVRFAAPGNGIVDYGYYFSLLKGTDYNGGLILHGIHAEDEFEPSISFIRGELERAEL